MIFNCVGYIFVKCWKLKCFGIVVEYLLIKKYDCIFMKFFIFLEFDLF